MVKNVDPLIELIPNLDEWFDLKNFNPPVYEYPSECFSDEYKSIIAKFLDDVSHQSISENRIESELFIVLSTLFNQL